MESSTNKPTITFWVLSILALFWNIMGVAAYLMQAYISDDAKALLSEGEQAYYNGIPAWVTAAFAIAVFSALLGCIAILLKKKIAYLLFIISLITVIIQFIYNFFIQDFMDVSGVSTMIMPIIVMLIAIFLVWYSKDCIKKGWLS